MGKKLLCDFIEDGILVVDRSMKVLFANRTLLGSCGLAGEDITGIPCHLAFCHSFLPCTERCPHREVFGSGKTLAATYAFTTPEQGRRIYEVNAAPVLDETGEITQMVEVFKDVTEQREAGHAQKNHSDFLRSLLDAFNEGVIVVDRELNVVVANQHVLGKGHLQRHRMTGRHCCDLFRRPSKACSEKSEECPVQETFTKGLPSGAIHTYLDEKGKEHYIALKTYPLRDKNGTVVNVVETLHDVTEKAENEIQEKIRIIQLKEEVETLREEVQRLRGSGEVMSAPSS